MESSSISLSSSVNSYTLTDDGSCSECKPQEISKRAELNSCNQQVNGKSTCVYTSFTKLSLLEARTPQGLNEKDAKDGQINMDENRNFLSNSKFENKDFYEEVDERMSRNSYEYPEQQANYVCRWLDDMELSKSKSLVSSSELGNVIGIRGIPTERKRYFSGGSSSNRFKHAYINLKKENTNLREQLNIVTQKLKLLPQYDTDSSVTRFITVHSQNKVEQSQKDSKDNKYEERKTVDGKAEELINQSDESNLELTRLKEEMKTMSSKLLVNEKEYSERLEALRAENDLLKVDNAKTKEKLEKELAIVKGRVASLSLEPGNKMISFLKKENCRLKDMKEIDNFEFETLKENYLQLEDRLRGLVEDQKRYDEEREKDVNELMLELCRLQVYQPKLEMILETERAIKVELQDKIESLEREVDLLTEQLKDQSIKLNNEKSRSRLNESVENETLHGELVNWQEKYYRLKKEKLDVDEMLRASKSKLSSLDTKYQSEVELVNDSYGNEIEKLKNNLLGVEKERNGLQLKLDGLVKKLGHSLAEESRLTDELSDLSRRFAIKESEEDSMKKKLKDREDSLANLRKQFHESEVISRNIRNEFENCRSELEQVKPRVNDLHARLELQQKTFEEFKEEKEKELSRMRIQLNFEKYNKQVALKGIEKELRNSLKELEAMKYRFSRRLATQNDSLAVGTDRANFNGSKNTFDIDKGQRVKC